MKALAVLFGGSLAPEAFEPVLGGKSALALAVGQAAAFPGVEQVILLGDAASAYPLPESSIIRRDVWTKRGLLEMLVELGTRDRGPGTGEHDATVSDTPEKSPGSQTDSLTETSTPDSAETAFLKLPTPEESPLPVPRSPFPAPPDLLYFAWADTPFLDPALAGRIAERHLRYAAEYSNADGWPCGLAPEALAPGTAATLLRLLADDDGPVGRDALFSVIEKDINLFDIETEISPVDLRQYRVSLAADSRRNLLLLTRFLEAGFEGAACAGRIIAEKPEILRTLPAFFPVQVSAACPQKCAFCPYPVYDKSYKLYKKIDFLYKKSDSTANFMPLSKFEEILDKIINFAGDGVVDISLWGEPALHPQAEALIRAVLDRPALSLVVETSGLGWGGKALESLTDAPPRTNGMAPVSWIVSLDAFDEARYREVRGGDYGEAVQAAERIGGLFPGSTYIQAVRVKGSEDDIEKFYRFWKDKGFKVIIQKYNNFAGLLPDLQTADLSPLRRNPCWHLARDFPVLIDGSVPRCFADCGRSEGRGNIFTESMETIWKRGEEDYRAHTLGNYPGICPKCDEYYTFNF